MKLFSYKSLTVFELTEVYFTKFTDAPNTSRTPTVSITGGTGTVNINV
jgi:hypothetical protein